MHGNKCSVMNEIYIKCTVVIFNSITRMSILTVVKWFTWGMVHIFQKGRHDKYCIIISPLGVVYYYILARGSWKDKYMIKSSYVIYIRQTEMYSSWISLFQI